MNMAEDMEKLLTKRFTDAVRKGFKPCPLIGPKWFRYYGDAKPPYFRFVGVAKLSKATGFKLESVVQRIVEHLDVKDLDAKVDITAQGNIHVRFNDRSGASPR